MARIFKSIRTRLTLAFIILAVGPILVVSLVLSYKSFSALKKEAIGHLQVEAGRVALAVEDYVRELERVLELTSRVHHFMSLNRMEQQNILEELLAYENSFEELTLIGNDGKELIRCNRIQVVFDNSLADRGEDHVFQQAMARKTNYFSRVRFQPESGEPHMTIAIPLQSLATGTIQYVLLGTIRLKKIWNLLAAISHHDETIFIVDDAGNIVGHPDPSVALSGKQYTLPDFPTGLTEGFAGDRVIMAAKRIDFGNHTLTIVAQKNASEALILARSIVFISLLVFVVALLVAVILSSLIIGNIIRPLQHLATVARNIQHGALDQQVEYNRDNEVGELGRAFNDMTSQLRQSIEKLREGEERFRLIMDGFDALVYVADMENYQLLFLNKSGRDLFGDVVGKTCWQVMQSDQTGPCEFCTNNRLLTGDGKSSGIYVWEVRNSLTKRWLECRDQAILWTTGQLVRMEIATDITRKKEAEEAREELEAQLRQAQKMEAIGTLAGGIAHDFNNILTVILGYNELAKMHLDAPEELQHDLAEVQKGAIRAKELVKQILTFSRKAEQQASPLQMSLIVKEALKMLRASIPTTIEIKQNTASNALVLADPTQIHQIIMNLCTNAYHAMRETGGTLAVSLCEVDIDRTEYNYAGLDEGRYLKLEVSDTGTGIDKKILDKIFEPYFTTKKPGDGTGMGLAVVHGIVKSHHGHIAVYSEPGKGTSFHVYLPLSEVKEVGMAAEIKPAATGGKGERILVVEDEEPIRNLVEHFLSVDGYQVQTCSNGVDALEKFKTEADQIDLVITDMTMPYLTGTELAQKILAIKPAIPIILCTGHSELINREKALAMGICEYLNKPILRKTLLEAIRGALDSKSRSVNGNKP